MTRITGFGLTFLAGGLASFAVVAIAAAQAQAPSPGRVIPVGERWVCRRPDADHPQNATTSDGKVALSCRQVNAAIPVSSGMIVIGTAQTRPVNPASQPATMIAPTLSSNLTPAQLQDQWQNFVRQALQLPNVTEGGG